MVMGDHSNTMGDDVSDEPQRAALGELKVKKKVPTNRADATRHGIIA